MTANNLAAMNNGIFITATDTGTGKTTLACALINALEKRQFKLCIRKPVESGCTRKGKILLPHDAIALAKASRTKPAISTVCPYQLQQVSSPAYAAQLENINLTLANLAGACQAKDNEYLLVEGAGGFYSPIAKDGLNADLAQMLNVPLLLVVADRLGCIGHTLLVIEAADKRGLNIAAIILNQNEQRCGNEDTDNAKELAALTDKSVVPVAFGAINNATLDRLVMLILQPIKG